MEISKNIEIIDLALYLKKENTLIISDIHIGYEESLNKQGIFIPRLYFKDTIKRLEKIITRKFDKIIINGDIKHEFGTISDQEWRNTLKLIDFLSKKCDQLILIKGNHDKSLGPISKKRNVGFVDNLTIGNKLIIHGHKLIKIGKNIKTIIIGHEHPAVSLNDKTKTETYKCFLKGKYKKYDLIVQPSFNLVTEGTNILTSKLLSPFLKQDLNNFECWIIGDKEYYFGKLKNIQ